MIGLHASAGRAAEPAAQSAPSSGDSSEWLEVGKTGFDTHRLVLASACPEACPWGELGEFVQEAMKPVGYDIILCRNCNRTEGPRLVGRASFPPPLVEDDLRHGTMKRIKAPVDFGITEASMLRWAYRGEQIYAKDTAAA